MFGTYVKDSFILVVAQLEVLLRAVEVLFEHWHIVLLQSVVQWQVAIVVNNVGPWSDFIYDWVLLVDADDVLNGLPFVVLGTTCLEEFIVTAEPVENILVTVPGTLKKRILSKVVTL